MTLGDVYGDWSDSSLLRLQEKHANGATPLCNLTLDTTSDLT